MRKLKVFIPVLIAALHISSTVAQSGSPNLKKDHEFQVLSVQPLELTVGAATDFEWNMKLPFEREIYPNDCIEISFKSPYSEDSSYKTFVSETNDKAFVPNCRFDIGPREAVCSITDPQTFRLTFNHDESKTFKGARVAGRSLNKAFNNPYSAREIEKVTVALYPHCETDLTPTVQSTTVLTAFQSAHIDYDRVQFKTKTEQVGASGAKLQVSFIPTTSLQRTGTIVVKVPAWYDITGDMQSTDSMLGPESEATFKKPLGFKITKQEFDSANRAFTIYYTSEQVRSNSDQIYIEINQFKTPVNLDTRNGFQLTTTDAQGAIIDHSDAKQPLRPNMQQLGKFTTTEMYLLGDENNQNAGRISLYNRVQIYLASSIPFQKNCYFTFKFPPEMKLDDNMLYMEGQGFFKPSINSEDLHTGLYEVDLQRNTVKVLGCTQENYLGSNPSGSVIFNYIKLPDYIRSSKGIQIDVYSDPKRSMGIIQSHSQLILNRDQLEPGLMDLVLFKPSNFYAWTPNVEYTFHIRPSHDLFPSARIIVTLPKHISFDKRQGCTVSQLTGKCMVTERIDGILKTEIVISEFLKSTFYGGSLIKFTICCGRNPTGARQAGGYRVRTEQPIGYKFYAIDAETSPESFYAMSGTIKSEMKSSSYTTFEKANYELELTPEHGITEGGFLTVSLPPGSIFMEDNVFSDSKRPGTVDKFKLYNVSKNKIIVEMMKEHLVADNPLRFSLLGVRNPRSFEPSSGFQIETLDPGKYKVDIGGQDINLVMNRMNHFSSLTVTPKNLTNGAVTDYAVAFASEVFVNQSDILTFQFPLTVRFTEATTCVVPPGTVDTNCLVKVTCGTVGKKLVVAMDELRCRTGNYHLIVTDIKNPPSTKKSDPFWQIFMSDSKFYDVQQVKDLTKTAIQTKHIANITGFKVEQTIEDYKTLSSYTVTFMPENEVSRYGVIRLTWSEQIEVAEDTECMVITYKKFTDDSNLCKFDREKGQLVIEGAFVDKHQYKGKISVVLTKVRNPPTNKNIKSLQVRTYDDKDLTYPIDQLEFWPTLECNYPCQFCGQKKDICNTCWPQFERSYLMIDKNQQTCKPKCDAGYSSNGRKDRTCSNCASSCKTCEDNGKVGDQTRCTECNKGYPVRREDTKECLARCPPRMYRKTNMVCGNCHSNCLRCSGPNKNECTQCDVASDSKFRLILGNQCVEKCPDFHSQSDGLCKACQAPCLTCITAPNICASCRYADPAVDFKKLLYGNKCYEKCQPGTIKSTTENKCEGCIEGCLECDKENNSKCYKCGHHLLLHENTCINECPEGYMSNFAADKCRSIDCIDVSTFYFPFVICMLLAAAISYIGYKYKHGKHRFLTGFIIMMGFLEVLITVVQLVLTTKYSDKGRFRDAAILLAVMLIINIVMYCIFYDRFYRKDRVFRDWMTQNMGANGGRAKCTMALMFFSWKSAKLFYGKFFHLKVKPAAFSDPNAFRVFQKNGLIAQVCAYYVWMVIACVYNIFTKSLREQGQLYMTTIENFIYCVVMVSVGLLEYHYIEAYMKEDLLLNAEKGKLHKSMGGLQEDFPEDGKIRFSKRWGAVSEDYERLQEKLKEKPEFLNYKLAVLLQKFGNRMCASCVEFAAERASDPRQCRSFHVDDFGGEVRVDDPPKPLSIDPYPNNVYAIGLASHHFHHFEPPFTDCVNKGIQVGGMFAGDMCRTDAELVSAPVEPMLKAAGFVPADAADDGQYRSSKKEKKRRGRKNRFFQQIDNEDNDAGVLLDSDSEGDKANETAKAKMIEQAERLDSIREEEEETERRRKLAIEAAQREAERHAAALAEAEEQRKRIDAQKQEEIERSKQFERMIREKTEAEEAQKRDEEELAAGINKLAKEQAKDSNAATGETRTQQAEVAISKEKDMSHAPDAALRNFNEIDIVGHVERDDKGNLIVEFGNDHDMVKSVYFDLNGQPINIKGYRIDPVTGDVHHNRTLKLMFTHASLDERGCVPAPFCVEKFNFNPFELQGTFGFMDKDDPGGFHKAYKAGKFLDKGGRQVNMQGFLIDINGSLLDRQGIKRFDWRQFAQFGGQMPKLYTYSGQRFDIHEVMGVFDRKSDGSLDFIETQDELGKNVVIDKGGNLVNSKGYIVNEQGDVCSRIGHILFTREQLRSDEFPKFFPFTRFNLRAVQGDYEMDPAGMPILNRKNGGGLLDKQQRLVNQKGYLVDAAGNVLDANAHVVFEAHLLDDQGDIPELFRMNLLRSESDSSISQLMEDLEQNEPFDEEDDAAVQMGRESALAAKQAAQAAQMADSFDSDMVQNAERKRAQMSANMPEGIEEVDEGYEGATGKRRKGKRGKNKKKDQYFVEEITQRDCEMAGAYGGVAKPRIRKVPGGIKLRSLNREKDRSALRASSQGKPQAPQMGNLFGSNKNSQAADPAQQTRQLGDAGQAIVNHNNEQMSEQFGRSHGQGWNSKQDFAGPATAFPGSQERATSERRDIAGNKISTTVVDGYRTSGGVAAHGTGTGGDPNANRQFEDEFEKMYKNDIQKFIEESSFEVASLEGLSQISKDSLTKGGSKMKNMEKVYLQRVEGASAERPNQPAKNAGTRAKPNFRDMGQAQIARAANTAADGRGFMNQTHNQTSNTQVTSRPRLNDSLPSGFAIQGGHGAPTDQQTATPMTGAERPGFQVQSQQDARSPNTQHVTNPFKDMPKEE